MTGKILRHSKLDRKRGFSWALLCLLVILGPCAARAEAQAKDEVTFSIVKRVQFTVPGDWKVMSSRSDKDLTVFVFQLPNPADEGTPDSTNLAVVSSYLRDDASRDAFEKKASERDPRAREQHLVESWSCSTFTAKQGATNYDVWDCYRVVAKCGVHVRFAWPSLPKNAPNYGKQMEMTLVVVLKSIIPSPKWLRTRRGCSLWNPTLRYLDVSDSACPPAFAFLWLRR